MSPLVHPDPLDLVVAELRRARDLLAAQERLLEQSTALAKQSTAALDATEESVRLMREMDL